MIHTRGLRRTFKGRRGAVEAVAGVDLDVLGGQTFGFLGPNGAGKTTTLRMLSTLLPVTSGQATVAWPLVGGMSVESIRSVVVLPAPFGPSTTSTSPPAAVKSTPSTAAGVPACP